MHGMTGSCSIRTFGIVDNVGNVLIPPDINVVLISSNINVVLIPPNIVEGGAMDIALDVNRRGHG